MDNKVDLEVVEIALASYQAGRKSTEEPIIEKIWMVEDCVTGEILSTHRSSTEAAKSLRRVTNNVNPIRLTWKFE